MARTIAIIAPLIDNSQFNLDYTVRLKDGDKDLSLVLLYKIAAGNYDPTFHDNTSQDNDIPAAGYYLQGILHANGYNTILTNEYDVETLKKLSEKDLFAVCVSTTMILTSDSFIALNETLAKEIPGVPVISGGMFLWKHYQQYSRHLMNEAYPLNREIFFHPSNAGTVLNIMIVAEQGIGSLMKVLDQLDRGSKHCFDEIPNLCIQDSGVFQFTNRKAENINYNADFTRWDLIEELPVKIPVRTSIGCPYRCGFCDFCMIFPRIFLRSAESLKAELKLIKDRLKGKAAIIHVTDDNVFINSKRLFEVCNIFSTSGLANWLGFMRGGEYTGEELKVIQNSGLRMGMIGVESGDQGQLDRMNKRQQVEKVKTGIEQLDYIGINTLMTFVIGFPGESIETLYNTTNFINGLNLSNLLSGYQAYPLLIHNLSDMAEPANRERWNIKGFMDSWSHFTMNSEEAHQACHSLFRDVKNIPYHYPGESHFFNRGMFSREKLSELYKLRHQLTTELMDNVPWEVYKITLRKMVSHMDLPVESANAFHDALICRVP